MHTPFSKEGQQPLYSADMAGGGSGPPALDSATSPSRSGDQALQSPPAHIEVPHQDGMVALIGGAAAASGSATSVTGSVENYSYDAGNYVVAWGDATFTAAGFSGDSGTPASADAATFVDVLGADFVFETSFHASGTIAGEAVAASETRYLAIDIVGWDPPGGPLVMDFGFDSAHASASNDSFFPGLLDGNFASVSATADAFGADSMADTLTSALVVQDHFSSVSGWAAIGV